MTNEDYVGALIEFEGGARGVLEADRSMFGPQSEMALEVHGSAARAAWDLETMNELRLYLPEETSEEGYVRLLGGGPSRTTATSCPAAACRSASRTWS